MSEPAKRPEFIKHYTEMQAPIDDGGFPDMGGFGSSMGRLLGLTRIGIHYEIMPPGTRSSFPHAESHEEEFVFIVQGTPDVWIDGDLHPLVAGDAVGFPAGTGIAHSFLNNSSADVHLIVIGEKNRPGNQLNYPLNPERMVEFTRTGRAWLDAPKRPLGPHDGKARAGTR